MATKTAPIAGNGGAEGVAAAAAAVVLAVAVPVPTLITMVIYNIINSHTIQ